MSSSNLNFRFVLPRVTLYNFCPHTLIVPMLYILTTLRTPSVGVLILAFSDYLTIALHSGMMRWEIQAAPWTHW